MRPRETERGFQRTVLELARLQGWEPYHTFFSKGSHKGWPDLTLIKPPRLVFAELKTDKGRLRPEQERMLLLLEQIPCAEVYVWRPRDWPSICRTLGVPA